MKKSQITLILIIGGILVVTFLVFQMSFSGAKETRAIASVKKAIDSGLDIDTIQRFGDKCVGEEIRKIIENQKTSLMQFAIDGSEYNKGNLVYLYETAIFKPKLNDSINTCFNKEIFEARGYDFEIEVQNIRDLKINREDISAIIDYHIIAKYKNQSGVIETFSNKYYTNFSRLLNSSISILSTAGSDFSNAYVNCDASLDIEQGGLLRIEKISRIPEYSTNAMDFVNLTYMPTGDFILFSIDQKSIVLNNCE